MKINKWWCVWVRRPKNTMPRGEANAIMRYGLERRVGRRHKTPCARKAFLPSRPATKGLLPEHGNFTTAADPIGCSTLLTLFHSLISRIRGYSTPFLMRRVFHTTLRHVVTPQSKGNCTNYDHSFCLAYLRGE